MFTAIRMKFVCCSNSLNCQFDGKFIVEDLKIFQVNFCDSFLILHVEILTISRLDSCSSPVWLWLEFLPKDFQLDDLMLTDNSLPLKSSRIQRLVGVDIYFDLDDIISFSSSSFHLPHETIYICFHFSRFRSPPVAKSSNYSWKNDGVIGTGTTVEQEEKKVKEFLSFLICTVTTRQSRWASFEVKNWSLKLFVEKIIEKEIGYNFGFYFRIHRVNRVSVSNHFCSFKFHIWLFLSSKYFRLFHFPSLSYPCSNIFFLEIVQVFKMTIKFVVQRESRFHLHIRITSFKGKIVNKYLLTLGETFFCVSLLSSFWLGHIGVLNESPREKENDMKNPSMKLISNKLFSSWCN